MVDEAIQPCTVCGSSNKSGYLFEKTSDGRGEGSIRVYHCGECKSVYLGKYSEIFDDQLYAYYAKYAGKTKNQVYNPLTKNSYFQVLKLLNSYGGGKTILDVGCGNGAFLDAAMEQGYDIKGIELSQSAIDIANRFNLPVKKIDFFSTEIESSSFDILTMFEVIEHLPEPVLFLQRAEHVVKRGGLIYITTPNYNSLDRRILDKNWSVFHREHLTYFTPATLIKAVERNTGFEVLYIETRNVSEQLIGRLMQLLLSYLPLKRPIFSDDVNARAPQSDTRAIISGSPWLSLIKRGINFFLNATGLGSTIVIVLKRPQ
jgi:2-polyprenyl-3-methyl-5-hydroxy-6-metoxy-1,4-benzoquinol methylase